MSCGKPNWILLKECGEKLARAGNSPFTRRQLIDCVHEKHPERGEGSLNPMIQGMTVNLKDGAPGGIGKNVFYSVDRGLFELYEPEKQGSIPNIDPDTLTKEGTHQPSVQKRVEEAPAYVGVGAEGTRRIYVTHCSHAKDNSLKSTGRKVTPDKLYTATPTQRFISKCRQKKAKWAIFSDLHGVWFPNIEHEWYEKAPDTMVKGDKVIDPKRFRELVDDFDQKLENYDEIWFYHNPGRFHPLYKRLLRETKLTDRVRLFTHIWEIM